MDMLGSAATLVVLPAHFALTQYRSPAMLGLASSTGIWGVSFVLWFFTFLVANLNFRSRALKIVGRSDEFSNGAALAAGGARSRPGTDRLLLAKPAANGGLVSAVDLAARARSRPGVN